MGHKEQLLEGAKQCLADKGYARTTARDIVAASGTNLASIGYHYGSKDALLTAAMVASIGDLTDRVVGPVGRPDADTPFEAFEIFFTRLVESFGSAEQVLHASMETYLTARNVPDLREQLSDAHELGRRGLVAIMLGISEEDVTEQQVRTLGSAVMALFAGVMVQYLIDPARTPTGPDLAEGLRQLMDSGHDQLAQRPVK